MNKAIILSALVFLGLNSKLHAGGCLLTEVSNEKSSIAMAMANEVRRQVIDIDNKTGGDNEVFIIARLGESMDGFNLLSDKLIQGRSISQILFKAGVETYRSGNKSPKGSLIKDDKLKYSHMGFYIKNSAYKANIEAGVQPADWTYVIHLLAQCDLCSDRYGESNIQYQMLDRFFWDSKIVEKGEKPKNQVLVMVPSKDVQKRLRELLRKESKEIAKDGLHEPNYNVISPAQRVNPIKIKRKKYVQKGIRAKDSRNLTAQNSNQWPLEMLAASLFPKGVVKDRSEAQQVLNHQNDSVVDCQSEYSSSTEQELCAMREAANTAYIPSIVTPTGFKTWNACGNSDGLFNTGLFWDATNIIDCDVQDYKKQKIFQLITVKSVADWMDKNGLVQEPVSDYKPMQSYNSAVMEITADLKHIKEFQEAGKILDKIMDARKDARILHMARERIKKTRESLSDAKRAIKKEMEEQAEEAQKSCER